MATKVKIRRDTAAFWFAKNPLLELAEPGYELDSGKLKIGNGIDDWNTLPYSLFGSTQKHELTLEDGLSIYTIPIMQGKTIIQVFYEQSFLTSPKYTYLISEFTLVDTYIKPKNGELITFYYRD